MNLGRTLFAQVMEFVPWKSFGRMIARHQGDRGVRTLRCAELFRILAFAQLTSRQSLRDIEACLGANAGKLFHMGIGSPPARTTLADALQRRDWRIYHALAMHLVAHARRLYADEPAPAELDATVYALDSTTIDLCLSLFAWAPSVRSTTRGAIKLHTLLDLRGSIPVFIHVSSGRLHDVNVLDMLPIEHGSFYVMDRGYLDYSRLYAIHQASAFFVTRAKKPMDARRLYSAPVVDEGVICDQRVRLGGYYAAQHYPELLRRIRFRDPASGRPLVFLTNNTVLPAATIAAIYKSRWQVELFFKWIKQHLRIQRFLGTSENAVKTQIWSAIATYVLVAIIRKELKLTASLYTCLQILSVSLFEKTQLSCALQTEIYNSSEPACDNQLNLFNF